MIATQNSLVNGLLPRASVNPLTRDVLLVALGVALLAISAQFKVPLGPVPVTLQALVVMLIGGVYGWRLGAVTVAAYVLDGIVLVQSHRRCLGSPVKISSATLLLARPPVTFGGSSLLQR